MTSPISIGDAILLSKLAYRLGHSVTVGRKHAPAGLQEVQNQLYSLGNALNSIAHYTSQDKDMGHDTTAGLIGKHGQCENLEKMIENCRGTLDELQTLTSKYDIIQETPDGNGAAQSGNRKWKDELKTNWKKVKWTTEGEELDRIRKNLSVHISSLNLLVAGMTHSQTRTIEGSVSGIHTMMLDVHGWFNENLKGRRAASATEPAKSAAMDSNIMSDSIHHPIFELSADLPMGQSPILLCPQARFQDGWVDALVGNTSRSRGVFRCCCPQANGDTRNEPHKNQVRFSLLSISLLVRLAGATTLWQMFCTANKVTSLLITGIANEVMDLAIFQEEVDRLATVQSFRSLARDTSSTLIYHSKSDSGTTSSVLDMKSDMSQFEGLISSASFRCDRTYFTQRSVDTIQILHYRTQEYVRRLHNVEDTPRTLLHQYYAEMVVHIDSISAGRSRLIILLDRTTACGDDGHQSIVTLDDVACQSENADGLRDDIRCKNVEIECITPRVAENLLRTVKSITRQLQVQYLQLPRLGERVVAERECSDMMIDHLYLEQPQAVVVFDPVEKLHRLILRSDSLSSTVTMELPEAYLRTTLMNGVRGIESDLEAYFVQNDSDGTRVDKGKTRFPRELLDASSGDLKRLAFRNRDIQ